MYRLFLTLVFSISLSGVSVAEQKSAQRPNVLLIVLDDLGFTDLGSFGGEISTPNLDQLAYDGLRLTSFYTAPTCSPTRSMLLTGTDHHLVGLGNMHEELSPNQRGKPGYEGYLNTRAATIAEVFSDAGYSTYMAGKWHLGMEENQSPAARGFEKSYALLNGGGGHFDNLGIFMGPSKYRENGKLVDLPDDFYSTRFYTNKILEYIQSGQKDGKPFFAYLAYTAVHWPLQAPAASMAKYRGRYQQGYDELYQQRIKGAINQGVVSANSQSLPRLKGHTAWADLSAQQRNVEARKMEIYAAMLDDVDVYIGKLVDHLKATNQYDNTVIFIMSDNGAEGHDLDHGLSDFRPWVEQCCNNQYDNMGKADSYLFLGPNWARATAGPVKHYKGFTTEGGIKAPAILMDPRQSKGQPILSRFISAKDVMPTLLQLAGVTEPQGSFNGRDVLPMTGRSFLPLADDAKPAIDMGWELMAKRGYRYGDWKLVHMPKPYGNGSWQLYNLAQDPGEQLDLSEKEPKILGELVARWQQYAKDNNVILPDWVSGY